MSNNTEQKYWFVLYTKPNQEKKAKEQLDKLNIESYLATTVKKKKWRDRIKKVEEVLLKSYTFITGNEKDRLAALELPSITRCLFDRGRIALVPDWQIQNLKNFLDKAEEVFLSEEKSIGKKVIIKEGPFKGIIGTIQNYHNKNYLSIALDFVKRTVTTLLPEDDVMIVDSFNDVVEEESQVQYKLAEKFKSVI